MKGVRSFVLGTDVLSSEENRSSPRILCHYEVNLRNSGHDFDAVITDIGITGMRIEGVPLLQRGEHFEISYPFTDGFQEHHSFEVEVMWCRRRSDNNKLVAGVGYLKQGEELAGSWVHALLTEVGLLGDSVYRRRKHLRLPATQHVALFSSQDGSPLCKGVLNNLSVGGALVVCDASVKVDQNVLALIGEDTKKPTLRLRSRVIHSQRDPEDGRHLISLQFIDFGQEEFKALQSLIMVLLEGRGHS